MKLPSSTVDHDCLQEVRPKYRDPEIDKNVWNALRRAGLDSDQTLDAVIAMKDAGIIFGELHMNGALDDC